MGNSAAVVAVSASQLENAKANRRGDVSVEIMAVNDAEFDLLESGGLPSTSNGGVVERRTVQLRLVFTKIGDIDTVRECFDASVYLEARWHEPKLDGVVSSVDTGSLWHPDLYIDNCIGDLKHKKEHEIIRMENGDTWVLEKHSIRGKFYEQMELWHFPFDTQDITVTVCSNLPDAAVDLVEMPDKPCRVLTSTFMDAQEWDLHTHVETNKASIISDSHIGPRQRPAFHFTTRATRRSMFYLVNIWFVSFILCALAVCVFGIERTNLQGRLQLSFLLLLTTITFKFVVTNNIPRVSYLTILDKAVLFNLLFLVLLSIWHSISSQYNLEGNEKYAIIAFSGVYVLAFAGLGISILVGAWRRKREMDEKDRQYQKRFAKARRSKSADSNLHIVANT